MRRRIALALCSLVLTACGDDGEGGPVPFPPEVEAVLEARCRPCHSEPPRRYAPMPLVDWRTTQRPTPRGDGRMLFELIGARVTDPIYPMPPKESPEAAEMTAAERETLQSWANSGAPSGP